LKRNGENCGARNALRADGVQKLTSEIPGRAERNEYQPWSVMAIVPCNGTYLVRAVQHHIDRRTPARR